MLVGVDLGGTRCRLALAANSGEVLGRRAVDTAVDLDQEAFVEWLAAQIEITARIDPTALSAVGIAAPGPLNASSGTLVNPPNLPKLHGLALAAMLSARLGLPVSLGKDTNVAAAAEQALGAGRECDDFAYVTWSTGIGCGLIANARAVTGAHQAAGEIGHLVLDVDGPRCACGGCGCSEAMASGLAIARMAEAALRAGLTTTLAASRPPVDARSVARCATAGDAVSLEILGRAARAFGLTMVGLINLFDPELIVLGGGLTRSWKLLRNDVLQVLDEHPYIGKLRRPKLRLSRFGQSASLIGAVNMAKLLGP